ncbi:hypothetical protein ACFXOD_07000 [Streptomyces sp. NPDC059161]|uniref:hypothetical protein n=1 Tax=Streptomyces sp. NPDC059161 TaxID=3346749 RepID=UPI0036CFE677
MPVAFARSFIPATLNAPLSEPFEHPVTSSAAASSPAAARNLVDLVDMDIPRWGCW